MGSDQSAQVTEKKLKAVPPIQSTTASDELSDTQLDRVSAGTSSQNRTPMDTLNGTKRY